jgi:hypothetical protein
MRVLFLSCDSRTDSDLIALATTMREKGHIVFVVGPTKPEMLNWPVPAEERLKDDPYQHDIPGHGWLPFAVNDLDATSYLLKRNIHAIILNRTDHVLEQVFVNSTNTRPAIVLLNPVETRIPPFRQNASLTINWSNRVSEKKRIDATHKIVKFVASRP